MRSGFVGLGSLLACAGLAVPAHAQTPTFNQDVAPILYAKCVQCHRPGEVAPMSLLSYQEARPWVRTIKNRVMNREMPPWFADARFGHFANDQSLTQAQIDTIVKWVDGGAPQGSGTAPTLPAFAEGWSNFMGRPPDAVVEMPMAFEIPAEGELPNFTLWSPNPFSEDKFMEAVQLRPEVIAAVHHSDVTARPLPPGTTLGHGPAWAGGPDLAFVPLFSDGISYNVVVGGGDLNERESTGEVLEAHRAELRNAAFRTTGDNRLLFYVPGGGFQRFAAGAVKRISAQNVLSWGLHYTPTGKPEQDTHRLGLWFSRTPPTHEVLTQRVGQTHIAEGAEYGSRGFAGGGGNDIPNIPPHVTDWKITAITAFNDDVTLYGMWPHMHVRGKDMMFVATYPDGREEVLLNVPKYDFNWQLQYELVTPVRLPAGSTIKTIGHYDNSMANRYNPSPDKEVYWSEQSWDEMFNGWMEVSVDKDVLGTPARPTQQQQQQ